MIWHGTDEYEALLQRRHEAEAKARQARRRLSLLKRYVNDTPVTQRIRADLANRARRLDRERAELSRQLGKAA